MTHQAFPAANDNGTSDRHGAGDPAADAATDPAHGRRPLSPHDLLNDFGSGAIMTVIGGAAQQILTNGGGHSHGRATFDESAEAASSSLLQAHAALSAK